jgi:hypothetical protein
MRAEEKNEGRRRKKCGGDTIEPHIGSRSMAIEKIARQRRFEKTNPICSNHLVNSRLCLWGCLKGN